MQLSVFTCRLSSAAWRMEVPMDSWVVEGRVRLFYFHFEIEQRRYDLLRILSARDQQEFDASFVKGPGKHRVLGAYLRVETIFDGPGHSGIRRNQIHRTVGVDFKPEDPEFVLGGLRLAAQFEHLVLGFHDLVSRDFRDDLPFPRITSFLVLFLRPFPDIAPWL